MQTYPKSTQIKKLGSNPCLLDKSVSLPFLSLWKKTAEILTESDAPACIGGSGALQKTEKNSETDLSLILVEYTEHSENFF